MTHKLFKVFIGRNDGCYGKFICKDELSQWLSKVDADHAIASGLAVRKNGPAAPYYAILEVEGGPAELLRPENASPFGAWSVPSGAKLILSTEAAREGKFGKPEPAPEPEPARRGRKVSL